MFQPLKEDEDRYQTPEEMGLLNAIMEKARKNGLDPTKAGLSGSSETQKSQNTKRVSVVKHSKLSKRIRHDTTDTRSSISQTISSDSSKAME